MFCHSLLIRGMRGQDEMGEARAVMRTLKEERDEIRSHLDGMQVHVVWIYVHVCVCALFLLGRFDNDAFCFTFDSVITIP